MSVDFTTDSASRAKRPLRPKSKSSLSKIVNVVTILVGIVCMWWIWNRGSFSLQNTTSRPIRLPLYSQNDFFGPQINSGDKQAPWIYRNGFMGMGGGMDHRRERAVPSPRPYPMYVANLDCKVDKFIVSAREVIGNSGQQRLKLNIPQNLQRDTLQNFQISLQIMSSDVNALDKVKDFGIHLTAVDDTGKKCITNPDGIYPIVTFTTGRARIVSLSSPSPTAKFLKEVKGEIILNADGDNDSSSSSSPEKSLSFVLHNIPLPVTNHIYSDVDAIIVPLSKSSSTRLAKFGEGDQLSAPASLTNFANEFPDFPVPSGPLNLPTHLILQDGVRANYTLYVQSGKLRREIRCSLLPHSDIDGEIHLDAIFSAASNTDKKTGRTFKAWLDEPCILSFPAESLIGSSGESKQILVRFRFTMYTEGNSPQPHSQAAMTFQAVAGERGAVLEGSVHMKGYSPGYGSIKMIVQKLTPINSQSIPKEMSILLDRNGKFKLANTAPGTYRIRITGYEPILTPFVKYVRWDGYIKRRFGINHPVWENETQELTLHAGGYSSLSAWNLIDSKM